MISVTVQNDLTESGAHELERTLRALERSAIDVGFFEDQGFHQGASIPLPALAAIHEFGATIPVTEKMRNYLASLGLPLRKETTELHIPARPFLGPAFDLYEADLQSALERGLTLVFTGAITVEQFFTEIGRITVGIVVQSLDAVTEPPLHPFTVARKGSTKPLIDTGEMRKAISFRIREVGEQ